jgi:hypothetical protein
MLVLSRMRTTLTVISVAALICSPIKPAVAAGPLLLAPVAALGHAIGAAARLATLPLIAGSAQAAAAYSPTPGYYAGAPAYYAPVRPIYRPAPTYYAAPYGYYGIYGARRGDYSAYARYSANYGARLSYRSGGFRYRRR